jgi:ADP-heptose:LPS heptosyltransferase
VEGFMSPVKGWIRSAYLRARRTALGPLYVKSVEGLQKERLRSVLVLRLDRIGDMVLTTPLFSALKEALPGVRVAVLASERNAPILKGNRDVDAVHVYERVWRDDQAAEEWDKEVFDLVVDPTLDYTLDWVRIARKIPCQWRLGYDIGGRGAWYNLRVPAPPDDLTLTESVLHLCSSGLGLTLPNRQPRLFLSQAEMAAAKALLAQTGGDESLPLVLIHPGGFYPQQRWPSGRFAEAAKGLREGGWCRPLAVGGSYDEPQLAAIAAADPRCGILRTTDLRMLIALMSLARVVVCNNSGPLHIACALGVRTVSILGEHTDRALWSPRGAEHMVLESRPIEALSSENVIAKVRDQLSYG